MLLIPGFLGRKLRRAVMSLLMLGVLLGAVGGGIYSWIARKNLDGVLRDAGIAESATLRWEPIRKSQAGVELRVPFTVRVRVKESERHNWIPTEKHGLVARTLVWSPRSHAWLEPAAEELPLDRRLELEALTRHPLPGELIDALEDGDPQVREVAARELWLRTEQDHEFRWDASKAERDRSVDIWRRWWEENRVRYVGEKVLDKVEDIFK